MTPRSAKAKGRRLQQEVRDKILQVFTQLTVDDVRSTSMGASGTDILLSPAAQACFPFATECKNTEKLNVWQAIEQAEQNKGSLKPLVVFSRNRSDTYVVLKFEDLLELLKGKQ
jgi:hypothetical protein